MHLFGIGIFIYSIGMLNTKNSLYKLDAKPQSIVGLKARSGFRGCPEIQLPQGEQAQ